MILAFSAIAALVGTDQFLKLWALKNLKGHEPISFIFFGDTEILRLHYVGNSGAAFGSFKGMTWALILFTLVMISFCIYYLVKNRKKIMVVLPMIFIIGGGLGNIIDRVFRKGVVVDYLDFQIFNFAVFNFADCCVTVGVAALVVYLLFFDDKADSKKSAEIKAKFDG